MIPAVLEACPNSNGYKEAVSKSIRESQRRPRIILIIKYFVRSSQTDFPFRPSLKASFTLYQHKRNSAYTFILAD